jgi:hypothetical protein
LSALTAPAVTVTTNKTTNKIAIVFLIRSFIDLSTPFYQLNEKYKKAILSIDVDFSCYQCIYGIYH